MKKQFEKSTFILLITFLFLMLMTNNVKAAKYAYSIGTNFDNSGTGFGGDCAAVAREADNVYSTYLTGVSSYLSVTPTYTYMRGDNPAGYRRIGSSVVFICGHGYSTNIICASSNTNSYRTGIYYGTDCALTADNGQKYTFAGLQSTNMNNNDLITFYGCNTGTGSTNLLTRAVSKGSTCAVGFKDEIYGLTDASKSWVKYYNLRICSGVSVAAAISNATSRYPNADVGAKVTTRGSTGITLSSNMSLNSGRIKNIAFASDTDVISAFKPIEDQYQIISSNETELNLTKDNIVNEPLGEYKEQYEKIINEIKEFDEEFNVSEYKVTYNLYDEDGKNGYILFTYYIDDIIETNKVYMVNINDGKIINIMLAGIEKENIKNIDNINLEFTINKVKEFEETKVDKIRKEKLDGYSLSNIKVNNSKKIIKSSISDEINSAEEKYSYNFNTEELIYTLNCKKVENVLVIDDSPIETMETATLEIKL